MIDLPTDVGPQSFAMSLVDFGGVLRPPLGGRIQRVNRLGNRYRIDITLPPMPLAQGRVWLARLIRGKTQGARMQLPAFEQGAPGVAVRANGATASGVNLPIDGLPVGYQAREGYWLSIEVGGQHYVHNIASGGTANASGQVTIGIAPLLRVAVPDNAVIHLAQPMIEGMIVGDELEWQLSLAHHLGLSFGLEEAA